MVCDAPIPAMITSIADAKAHFSAIVAFFLTLTMAFSASAAIVYYDAINGKDSNDGTTEQKAKCQPAFTDASHQMSGEVRLMKGVYTNLFIVGGQNAVIRGWKASREEVIIDGCGKHDGIKHYSSSSDWIKNTHIHDLTVRNANGRGVHLVCTGPLVSNCVIYACTNTGVNASGAGIYANVAAKIIDCVVSNCTSQQGGGIFLGAQGSELKNVRVEGNVSTGTSTYGTGGGLLCSFGGATLTDCHFVNNVATYMSGGGISMFYATAATSTPNYLTNCVFVGNRAGAGGGAFTTTSTSCVYSNYFVRCAFSNNVSGADGGAVYSSNCGTRPCATGSGFEDCEFVGNSSASAGGAVSVPPFFVRRCKFIRNRTGYAGGGLNFQSTAGLDAVAENCLFEENVTTNSHSADYQYGGGCAVHKVSTDPIQVVVRNCLFIGNVVSNGVGGALGLNNTWSAQMMVENCTFVKNGVVQNTSGTSGTGGGAVGCYNAKTTSTLTATNCVFWENWAPEGCTADVQISSRCATSKFGYCLEQDATGKRLTDGENGNVVVANVAKVFADYANGDYTPRLRGSLFDRGLLMDWMAGACDLANNPRVREDASAVDIGCYEYRYHRGLVIILR